MTHADPFEDRLRSARFPEPAPDLRGRVLVASLPHLQSSTTWAERTWFSRRTRFAAVALLFAVVALDRATVVPGPLGGERPGAAAVETARAAAEAARQAGLPADEADALAERALVAASRPAARTSMSIDDPLAVSGSAGPENR